MMNIFWAKDIINLCRYELNSFAILFIQVIIHIFFFKNIIEVDGECIKVAEGGTMTGSQVSEVAIAVSGSVVVFIYLY